MTIPAQKKFNNPSRLFIWLFSVGNFFRSDSYYKQLLENMKLTGNESVLDFGSGTGYLAKKLAPKLQPDGNLTCIDVSNKLISHVQNKLKKYSNISYYSGEIINQSIPDQSYDFIVSSWVIHHVDKSVLSESIQKFHSLLKDQGKAYIIEFSDEKYSHTQLKESELIDLFVQAKFSYKILFRKGKSILYEFSRQ